MKSVYIECECSNLEHLIRINVDTEDEYLPVWMEFHLSQFRPWYKRIGIAIGYIFGHKSKFGAFDVVTIDEDRAKQIIETLKLGYPNI